MGLLAQWDHPRSRGEYVAPVPFFCQVCGSSPLSRGILALALQPIVGYKDHPRSRGEYFIPEPISFAESGSSPLSRGIQCCAVDPEGVEGIIPALAGNTSTARRLRRARADHPRSRGEYRYSGTGTLFTWGSSPLSRGIPHRNSGVVGPCRIIPALAGNTPRIMVTRPP